MLDTIDRNDAPPDVGERYATAINATSLLVVEHRSGAVDVLAAAAWSPQRIGAQLLRLHSEFDGGQRATQAVRMVGGKQVVPPDTRLLAIRLKSMRGAREQLTLQAVQWRIDNPRDTAQRVLLWWLDRLCPACSGRRWRLIQDTPSLSGQTCGECHGSGEIEIPHGAAGRKLAGFLDDCVNRARESIKQRLRNSSR